MLHASPETGQLIHKLTLLGSIQPCCNYCLAFIHQYITVVNGAKWSEPYRLQDEHKTFWNLIVWAVRPGLSPTVLSSTCTSAKRPPMSTCNHSRPTSWQQRLMWTPSTGDVWYDTRPYAFASQPRQITICKLWPCRWLQISCCRVSADSEEGSIRRGESRKGNMQSDG